MTRGPLFAAGLDGEGQGNPKGSRGWVGLEFRWPSSAGHMVNQLRWLSFKEEREMPILGPCGTELAVRSVQ